MKRCFRVLALLAFAAALPFAAGPAMAKKKDRAPTVPTWLVLGPALDALPVFHDADVGGVEPAALLDGPARPGGVADPVAGANVPWFDGTELTWTKVSADEDGTVRLDVPREASAARPATASCPARASPPTGPRRRRSSSGAGPSAPAGPPSPSGATASTPRSSAASTRW